MAFEAENLEEFVKILESMLDRFKESKSIILHDK